MPSQASETKEPLSDQLTQDQIDKLIAERKAAGATSCQAVTESGQKFLVSQWPPLGSSSG